VSERRSWQRRNNLWKPYQETSSDGVCRLSVYRVDDVKQDTPQLSWRTLFKGEYQTLMQCVNFLIHWNRKHNCCQIFELEDQLDSALDIQDQGVAPALGHSRGGPVGRPRESVGSNASLRVPSQSSRKRDSSPGPQIRHRIVTSLNRTLDMAAQASPLAQLYHPVIVDEAIPEDSQPHSGTRDAVSYGPVSRRRLSSATTLQRMRQPSRERDMIAQSPDQHSDLLFEPETAGETEEKEATLGSLEWERRLDSIEGRQKRIEELLTEVLTGLRRGRTA
jgi:hypothetical protein